MKILNKVIEGLGEKVEESYFDGVYGQLYDKTDKKWDKNEKAFIKVEPHYREKAGSDAVVKLDRRKSIPKLVMEMEAYINRMRNIIDVENTGFKIFNRGNELYSSF